MTSRLAFVAAVLAMRLAAQGFTVVNGASFKPEVSAGSWATAQGAFGTVATTTASAFPIGPTLNGVSVTVDNAAAPVYYVSSTQINFLVPYATTPGIKAVQVKTAASTFTSSMKILSAAPGVFILDFTANPPTGAILNQNNTVNGAGATAKRGEVIQIFGTGPGALSSTPGDGTPVVSPPLVTSKSTPQVFIGGVEASVGFSGMTPGAAGLWQVNATVPNLAFITGRVPVRVFIDGVDANEVSVFVQ